MKTELQMERWEGKFFKFKVALVSQLAIGMKALPKIRNYFQYMEKESWKHFLTVTLGGVSSAAAEINWAKQR